MKTPLSPRPNRNFDADPTRLLPCAAPLRGIRAPSSSVAWEYLFRPRSKGLAPRKGSIFGRYRIIKSLGNGGFGDVWLAEQQAPVRREVALKLIRPGFVNRGVISRFERETQAMAIMEHENIAKVYDASSVDGTLYFAMEYVAGLPITKHVKVKNLTLQQRIELFIPVCRAVHHAHQKGVLHRDLKPANILVAERDGVAVPKVIDFGIAKPLSEGHCMEDADTGDMPATLPGYCVGTPQYMSPEQALGRTDINAASDTYALGVVLYEMLVGEPPITKREMEGLAPHQRLDRVIECEAELPSTLWLSATASSNTRIYDKTLGDNPKRISRQMRGDLDWIVRKALEKDHSLRYSSADKLADDLAAYLRNEPISVGPPSLGYRFRKSYRRHRLATLATFLVLCAMLSGGIAFDQSQRAEAARTEESHSREQEAQAHADSDRAKAEALDLVNFMLNDLAPKLEAANQTSLRQSVADKAAAYYQEQGDDLADTRAQARQRATIDKETGLIEFAPGRSAAAIANNVAAARQQASE